MENKIARISWKRGQYSDVYRSTIVDPSPLKEGQKVKVVWGKTRKEYATVVACYPLEEQSRRTEQPSATSGMCKEKIGKYLFSQIA